MLFALVRLFGINTKTLVTRRCSIQPFGQSKKLGHQVMFISGVGNDIFGDEALNIVTKLELDTQFINKISYNTGTVIINANSNGADKFNINLPASLNISLGKNNSKHYSRSFSSFMFWNFM